MNFSNDKKVDMLFVYSRCLRNTTKSLAMYSELYPERRQPNHRYFQRIENTLRNYGSFEKPSERKCTVTECGGDNEIVVLGFMENKKIENKEVSLRKIAHNSAIFTTSRRKILKKNKFIELEKFIICV
ncbi:uncharacterized protein [Leptinotarsa decemlineata]|uniref:uncharacterized protein n=1 Tax=Leptinotarsa decemlineata TaxID=7539 RepID=UPI003D308579